MRLLEADAIALTSSLEQVIADRNWTMLHASALAGTTPQHLYRILRGESNPTLARLLFIARAWNHKTLFNDLTMLL